MTKKTGKITLVVLVLLFVCIATFLSYQRTIAEPTDSYNIAWQLVRDTATEDGTNFAAVYNLDANEGNWASKDSSTVANGGPFRLMAGPSGTSMQPISPGNKWAFVICGGVEDNDTFSYNIVGWAQGNGMAQIIGEGAGVIGTQDVVLYPDDSAAATNIWWADTITLDETTKWSSVAVINSGDNEVAQLVVETIGLEYLQFVIYDADGTGTEANDVTVYGRPY